MRLVYLHAAGRRTHTGRARPAVIVILLPGIWQLRENVSAYDAAYLALAELLEAPLLTFDEKLANTPGNMATFLIP